MTDSHPTPPGIIAAAAQFGPFDGRVWLNTAHQGPLPHPAVDAATRAAASKSAPHRIGDEEFTEVPEQLRSLLARLVGAAPDQIALGNSTSHGLHLIANSLTWTAGDEVLVLAGDYPATILPWQRLADHGVRTTALQPTGDSLTADELAAAITPRTRVLAVTWVDSFTGRALDLDALGAVCRQAGVLLVVNASQALGARPIDVSRTPIDALVSCGYKWLCGPYGTGFSWLHPDLLATLVPQQAYWLAMRAGGGLDEMRDTRLRDDLGIRAFDVFCPANFLTVLPWTASLRLLLDTGVTTIANWDQRLVDRLIGGLDPDRYRLISPARGPDRSTLVVISDISGDSEQRHRELLDAGIDTAYREGNLRLSTHLFNTTDEIDRTLDALQANNS
ncbi:MAG TPA: aminotransferase class V-fold PLP-dependent enzyme [Pseudonocardiaceae bacterium]|jgi:selenocysteine lyase/cysteine desulfurase|nr:aminotransferase class V-fold PLP-dependent enzyme [Pseudonocardiaceae bacterium]